MDYGSLALGGYGLAKGLYKMGTKAIAKQAGRAALSNGRNSCRLFSKPLAEIGGSEVNLAGKVAKGGATASQGAESLNAGVDLNRKLSQLEKFQETAARTRTLYDGRIRYYDAECISRTSGPTRSACNVLEWNPRTCQTRWWYECHDHLGNVNRVHPKCINGQIVLSPHYPPTGKELMR